MGKDTRNIFDNDITRIVIINEITKIIEQIFRAFRFCLIDIHKTPVLTRTATGKQQIIVIPFDFYFISAFTYITFFKRFNLKTCYIFFDKFCGFIIIFVSFFALCININAGFQRIKVIIKLS